MRLKSEMFRISQFVGDVIDICYVGNTLDHILTFGAWTVKKTALFADVFFNFIFFISLNIKQKLSVPTTEGAVICKTRELLS